MKIKVKRIREIDFPGYQHPGDSGIDLINAYEDTLIEAGERKLIPTGIIVAIPEGYEIQLRSRSGLAIKKGVMVLNSPGTIDSGYRGEVGVILYNTSDDDVMIHKGMRIAQAVLQKIEKIEWEEFDVLPESNRSSGGFGSTGEL
ncbi:MAG: dUTP diphosphatase [Elusimicrobiota bacterium]